MNPSAKAVVQLLRISAEHSENTDLAEFLDFIDHLDEEKNREADEASCFVVMHEGRKQVRRIRREKRQPATRDSAPKFQRKLNSKATAKIVGREKIKIALEVERLNSRQVSARIFSSVDEETMLCLLREVTPQVVFDLHTSLEASS
ncbi:MAG: hypothetical protein CL576_13570 [Alteromonas sp.]|nr:hypothetical protein [Alteromonas sp.]MBS09895.1 hypothetical protein [Alteromonas sp.]|tara:strand:+ start:1187 stop:1624 length:438 start_codon:yes stop_codon:yes gene_type:complete